MRLFLSNYKRLYIPLTISTHLFEAAILTFHLKAEFVHYQVYVVPEVKFDVLGLRSMLNNVVNIVLDESWGFAFEVVLQLCFSFLPD